MCVGEAAGDGGGEEVVPGGVGGWEPARRGVHEDLLEGVVLFAPDVEGVDLVCDGGGRDPGLRVGGLRSGGGGTLQLRAEQHGPEDLARAGDDGRGGGIGGHAAVEAAEEVGGLFEPAGIGCAQLRCLRGLASELSRA